MRVFFPHDVSQGHALHHASTWALEALAWVGLLALLAHGVLWAWRLLTRRDSCTFVPWRQAQLSAGNVLVTGAALPAVKNVPTISNLKVGVVCGSPPGAAASTAPG